jgi:hypothetical protein
LVLTCTQPDFVDKTVSVALWSIKPSVLDDSLGVSLSFAVDTRTFATLTEVRISRVLLYANGCVVRTAQIATRKFRKKRIAIILVRNKPICNVLNAKAGITVILLTPSYILEEQLFYKALTMSLNHDCTHINTQS